MTARSGRRRMDGTPHLSISGVPHPSRDSISSRTIPIHTFVASADRVVTEESIKTHFRDPPPRRIPRTDHNTLQLPMDRSDVPYLLLRNALNEPIAKWFRALATDAANTRSPTHHRSFLQLSRAYESRLAQRLDLSARGRQWRSATAPQERRHLLGLLIGLTSTASPPV